MVMKIVFIKFWFASLFYRMNEMSMSKTEAHRDITTNVINIWTTEIGLKCVAVVLFAFFIEIVVQQIKWK